MVSHFGWPPDCPIDYRNSIFSRQGTCLRVDACMGAMNALEPGGRPTAFLASDGGLKRLLQQEPRRLLRLDRLGIVVVLAWSAFLVEFRGDPVEVLGRVD
jgi:hypothetical protein